MPESSPINGELEMGSSPDFVGWIFQPCESLPEAICEPWENRDVKDIMFEKENYLVAHPTNRKWVISRVNPLKSLGL
jgi:hypothetical protein